MRLSSCIWPALTLLLLSFASMFAPGCTCAGERQRENRPILACQANTKIAPPLPNRTIVSGASPVLWNGTESGASITLPMTPLPDRGGMTPSISLHYHSENDLDQGLGVGFSLSAGSSITRRNKTKAMDGRTELPNFDPSDAFAMDGKPLVVVSQSAHDIEYRTFPDSQIKVVQYVKSGGNSYFEAFFPDGTRILYTGRPRAITGEPQAWLAEEKRDPRGNKIQLDWCLVGDDVYTAEFALTSIRSPELQHVVVFVYEKREKSSLSFVHGMQRQESLRLREVQMFSADTLVRRYELNYRESSTTGRTLLESVQQCAANGECFAPTEFQYHEPDVGFEEIVTDIDVPLADKASPMFFDIDQDGLPEYVVGDTTPASTPDHPITQWRIAKNLGGNFAPEKMAFWQEWSFVPNAEGFSDAKLIQPELATAIQTPSGTGLGLFLHDVTGSNNNHLLMVPKPDLTFALVDTKLPRPFPLATSPAGLRSAAAATHLVDLLHDGMADLLECNDHGHPPETALLSQWKLYAWKPGGFVTTGETITPLAGIPCNVETTMVDVNGDSITDVVFPGYMRQGGVPTETSGTYSVLRRAANGEWGGFDLGLPTPLGNGHTLFVDVNADGLPDAVQSGSPDGRLYTYKNTGKGFSNNAEPSLFWDGLYSQAKYFHLAQPFQYDGDRHGDLLLPMLDADHPTIPHWVILRATGNMDGPTFEAVDAGIPFDAVWGDEVTLADPRIPRTLDIDNDGAAEVAIFLGSKLHIFRNRAADADVLVGYSDGTNDRDSDDLEFVPNVAITYGHLTDGTDLYRAHEDAANSSAYPRHAAVGPQRVVKEYAIHDGQGGQRRYGLRYRDGRYDRDLRQWLGFGKRILKDLDTGETTIDFYDNVTKEEVGARSAYPFLGQVVKQWQYAPGLPTQPSPDLVEMTFAEKTLEVVPTNKGQSYFTLATQTRTRRMQGQLSGPATLEAYIKNVEAVNSATMLRDSTVNVLDWDEYRHVLDVAVTTVGVDTTMRITRTVKNDVDNWQLGLPDTQTECSHGAGIEQCRTISRTTNTFGEVETESTSSKDDLKDARLEVRYERDQYGNVTKTLADDGYGKHREETTEYDAEGTFPTKHINALKHERLVEYDAALGVLRKETDANGLTTQWSHDGFGRLISTQRPDGSNTSVTRSRERIDGVWRTRTRTTTAGGAEDEVITDSLGRTMTTFTFGPAPKGETTRLEQVYEYDRLSGELARQSIPTSETTPVNQLQWHEYEFDALGRIVRHETPWGAITTTKYEGLTTEVRVVGAIGELPQITKTATDALGRPTTMTDANGGITRHTYGPFDTLRTITDPGNDVMTWNRDAFGRPTKLEDPNRGTTTFAHDGFGDLVSSTDALGRTATYTRDALGRLEKRVDTHLGKTLTTSWTWDIAANGKGKLRSLTSPDAVKTYSYNAQGQLEKLMLTTNGDSLVATWTYDALGRSKVLTYPQPLGEMPFTLTREYDTHGFVIGVRDEARTYWELESVDDGGRYKAEQLGNGLKTTRSYDNGKQTLKTISTLLGGSTIQNLAYDYDGLLNLKSRTDSLQAQNTTERFRYDQLNRLTCAYFSANDNPAAACAQSFGYAANGNLLSKSEVGTLLYADAKHPHAVTNAQGDAFTYDAVGNQITRPGGVSIAYTPFDLPSRITQGADVTTFGYDGDERRIRKTTSSGETLYFEELFEQVTVGNAQAFRYFVHSPERVIAVITHGGDDPGTKWLSVDNLGSVESVTDDQGVGVEKRSYDAFGAKRSPIWGVAGNAAPSKTTKGFTGHEEEDDFGLINMRGRLYDPRIARFTTPDPIIASIYDGQSLNAFAYVWNNPLSYVDPSGFEPEKPAILPIFTREVTHPDGSMTVDLIYPPREGEAQKTLADLDSGNGVGAGASTGDTSTTGASGNAQKSAEGLGSFFEGLFKGNLSDDDSWSATLGSVVGGLIPGVGLVADIRDLGAAVSHIAEGKEGAWLELGASVIGFVPGGDIAKGIAKGVTKASTKAATKVGVELVDDAAKIVKGSTATAADGLTSAQKTAGKVNAPRGPPGKRPGNRGHDDHRADVEGGGKDLAQRLKRPGETLESEKAIKGHTGISRRADNQIIGTDGNTRVVVESERRPGGSYHKKRVKELEAAGIEVITRPPSQWGK